MTIDDIRAEQNREMNEKKKRSITGTSPSPRWVTTSVRRVLEPREPNRLLGGLRFGEASVKFLLSNKYEAIYNLKGEQNPFRPEIFKQYAVYKSRTQVPNIYHQDANPLFPTTSTNLTTHT